MPLTVPGFRCSFLVSESFEPSIRNNDVGRCEVGNSDCSILTSLRTILNFCNLESNAELFELIDKAIQEFLCADASQTKQTALGVISIISTILRDSISKQLEYDSEKHALECDLQDIANLKVRQFRSEGPIVEILEFLRERTLTVC